MKQNCRLTRRGFLTAAATGATVLGLYTWRFEPHWIELVRGPMPIRNLPAELAGARLMHVSDLHIGPQVDDEYLVRVFASIQTLSPEIVVYTGDFVSYHTDLREHAPRLLSQLPRGTLGTLGILGNHDYGTRWQSEDSAQRVVSLAEQAGVRVLRNELADVRGLSITSS